MKNGLVLDVGCGDKKTPMSIGLDIIPLPGVDVVHDINIFPYPFKDNMFDKVIMNNILEHSDDMIKVMGEIYRILKPGGIVHIEVCYWNYHHSYSDPQHKHSFTEATWDFFTGERKAYYCNYAFKMDKFSYQYDWRTGNLLKALFCGELAEKHNIRTEQEINAMLTVMGQFFCNIIAGMVVELKK